MNSFETPDEYAAHLMGLSLTDYWRMCEAEELAAEAAFNADPEWESEARESGRLVSETEYDRPSPQDETDLIALRDIEEWEGMGR